MKTIKISYYNIDGFQYVYDYKTLHYQFLAPDNEVLIDIDLKRQLDYEKHNPIANGDWHEQLAYAWVQEKKRRKNYDK